MCPETNCLGKLFLTYLTSVWFLSSMKNQMLLEIADRSKLFLTHVTGMWFLFCMNNHMFIETTGPYKLFLA